MSAGKLNDGRYREWSIGIYRGPTPFKLAPATGNPVITARQISDVDTRFVADPFMLRVRDNWYMYFEILPQSPRRGVIGLATSGDGNIWTYQGIVLAEPFHLSYPHVFFWQDFIYMTPESAGAGVVRLYKARSPTAVFEPVVDLLQGCWADPTVFFHAGRWWMFACSTPYEHRTLHLFFGDDPRGPWHPHPQNPIVADDAHRARPAGRVRVVGGVPIRFAQDCIPRYGTQVRAFEILEISPACYREQERAESPILQPAAQGWNSVGMHHIDAHPLEDGTWMASVDGMGFQWGAATRGDQSVLSNNLS